MTLSNRAKAFSVVNLLQLPVETTSPAHTANTGPGNVAHGYLDNKCQSQLPLEHEEFRDRVRTGTNLLPTEAAVNKCSELDKIKEMWMLLGYDQCKSGLLPEIPRTGHSLKRSSEDYQRHGQHGKARCHGNEKRPRCEDLGEGVGSSRKQRPLSNSDHGTPGSAPDITGSSCFCHGETMFCQHPGIQTILDTNGSGSSLLVELCHSDLWSSFHRLGTEMIITKSGRRMFPVLKLRVSGLARDKMYSVKLEFAQPDSRKYRYIYNNSRWMVSGSGDALTSKPCHVNPECPVSGQALCSQILSFERLKMTNTDCTKPGQVSLVSMQKFQPQIVIEEVFPGEARTVPSRLEHYVINFPQTSFMAVTAYQNQQITTLKIASNPFAKGFRESGKARVTYEALAAQYPGIMGHKNYPDFSAAAPLLPGLFQSGMTNITKYFDEDCVYSEVFNNDKRIQSPQPEYGSSAPVFSQYANKSSAPYGYPFYYLPFSPPFDFIAQQEKWRTAGSDVALTITDIHKSLTPSKAKEPSGDVLPSLHNLDLSCNTPDGRLQIARLQSTDAEKHLQLIYQQYLRYPRGILCVPKSESTTQKIIRPNPYGLGLLQSDSNSPTDFNSNSRNISSAESESGLMSSGQFSDNIQLQGVWLKSSPSPTCSPGSSTGPPVTSWLSECPNFEVIHSMTSHPGCLSVPTSR